MRTENLAIGYKNNVIAYGLNLSLPEGVTALIGRNGAGKTTLLKTLTGDLEPLAGNVVIGEQDIREFSRRELSKKIAVVSTETYSAGGLRLYELVGLGRIPYTGRFGFLSREDKEKIEMALNATGIYHKRDSYVSELSDGERQRGMIARGLTQETPIMIMDEPFAFLDVAGRLEMIDLILRLAEDNRKTILFSTHDIGEALRTVKRLWVFTPNGLKEGETSEMIENEDIGQIFDNPNIQFDKKILQFYIKR